jgi:surface antigen
VRAVSLSLGLAAVFAGPALVLAANVDKDIPYANFTAADRAIFQQALDTALDKGVDGVTTKWDNAQTKARGDIRPTKSFERDGKPCRTLEISNHAKGRSASGPFTFCKADTGKWALTTVAPAKAAPKQK